MPESDGRFPRQISILRTTHRKRPALRHNHFGPKPLAPPQSQVPYLVQTAPACVAVGLVTVILAASSVGLPFEIVGPRTYQTALGKTAHVPLSDGNDMELNTSTTATWKQRGCDKVIDLKKGEALVYVFQPHDCGIKLAPRRGRIEMQSGRMNVFQKEDGNVIVTVIQGSATVTDDAPTSKNPWSRVLTENEEMEYGDTGPIVDVHKDEDAADRAAWRVGLLFAHGIEFGTLMQELSRYSKVPISVDAPCLSKIRMAGAVDVFNADLVKTAEASTQSRAIRHPDGSIGLVPTDETLECRKPKREG